MSLGNSRGVERRRETESEFFRKNISCQLYTDTCSEIRSTIFNSPLILDEECLSRF